MNPDETKQQSQADNNEDIAEVKAGEADPLDSITDVAEAIRIAKANRSIAQRYKSKAKAPQPAPSATQATPAPEKPQPALSDEYIKKIDHLELSERKRQIGFELQLSPKETDTLFRFAGGSDPREAFKDPFFQKGLNETRKETSVREAIPSSTNRSTKVDGKTFAEMTPEERQKNWGKITGGSR